MHPPKTEKTKIQKHEKHQKQPTTTGWIIEQLDTPANIVLNPATEYVRKFTEEVPREKVLKIEDVMDKKNTDNLGDLKVSKDEIIEEVAEKILTQEDIVGVTDQNNKIIGSIKPSKIIDTVFGGKK